jgi:dTDP-4-amino-4,6-dideoxygalactose transaminase
MIPMVDLLAQLAGIREEVLARVKQTIESGQYVLGKNVREFEVKAAEFLGTGYAVGVASGTDALHLALKALGVGPGDEVVTTPFTFFSTVEAIIYLGARPVLADIDPKTFNIDPGEAAKKITAKTRAILPVHLFGYPAPMEAIMELAGRHGLVVVEDCAQSFGASLKGRQTGSFGEAGCFSFYPSKNLGCYGDGGLIAMKDGSLAEEVRSLRNHGQKKTYIHEEIGFNSRLDELQAAILLVKLGRISEYNEARRRKAALYTELLGGHLPCPSYGDGGGYHVYHQYTLRHPRRDALRQALLDAGVSSMIYYPVPLHMQPALKGMAGGKGSFPHAERAAQEVLSLPIYPELEDSAIERIAQIIRRTDV